MKLSCPICSKKMEIQTINDLPSFPFCSERCKLIDLGRWIDGGYTIPGREKGNMLAEDEGEEPGAANTGDWLPASEDDEGAV
jgi:endogenous inhibitor of DNA gyrase (YacG/DUF329 family)